MDTSALASEFLLRHHMHPSLCHTDSIVTAFQEDMLQGLRGESSSLGMFPAFINPASSPMEGRALLIDAGGTNLRLGVGYYFQGRLVLETVQRLPMPGTAGEITAQEFFTTLAKELLPLCEGVEHCCFCFSYPCELLSNGDGRVVRLTKELSVAGLPGMLLCSSLETELIRQGAKGKRRWRVINDTVGCMLGGMAQAQDDYTEYMGFILGTGFNMCAPVASPLITKAPSALSVGESCIVNFESGGFSRFPRGTADHRLDEESEVPGAQLIEKCISGGYQALLLTKTLLLAMEDGLFSPAFTLPELSAQDVSLLADSSAPVLFPAMDGNDYALMVDLNRLLLERAALLSACVLSASIRSRQLPGGSRVCICADGTTFARNPLLQPRTAFHLDALLRDSGVTAEFLLVSDATLLGTAYAALLP